MALPTPTQYRDNVDNLSIGTVTRPAGIASQWVTAIAATQLDDADNAGADIQDPDSEINSTRPVYHIKEGTVGQIRMAYEDAAVGTPPVIQAFGRTNADGKWKRLHNRSNAADMTLQDAAADVTDGTMHYTHPDEDLLTFDLMGCNEVVLAVKTALVGSADATTAYCEIMFF